MAGAQRQAWDQTQKLLKPERNLEIHRGHPKSVNLLCSRLEAGMYRIGKPNAEQSTNPEPIGEGGFNGV